jgi:preprotein translocase subunit SecE
MQKIINFFKEVKAEFKQISWPKRESIIQSTIVVISISIIVSLILGGFDYLFIKGMALIGPNTKTQPQSLSPTPTPFANPLLEPTISK